MSEVIADMIAPAAAIIAAIFALRAARCASKASSLLDRAAKPSKEGTALADRFSQAMIALPPFQSREGNHD